MKKGNPKNMTGIKVGGSSKGGPGLKLKGDYKADTFGSKKTKAPKKSI